MLSSGKPNLCAFGSWRRAATLVSGVVALGLIVGWPTPSVPTAAPAARVQPSAALCASADDVSNFVCRNTWMAGLRRTYR